MFKGRLSPRFATLPETMFQHVAPSPLPNAHRVAFSPETAALLGVDGDGPDFIRTFSGNDGIADYPPLSSVYSGHQFGYYVPQLGDGRAHLIAEVETAEGVQEIQLKGSGQTPFSRFGDGRAVLRSCIREFLASEAMAALGIPTTRALCIIGSDEPVRRETMETAAVLTRVAPSHLRFGHFEYLFHTGQHETLRELADFTIRHYYPDALATPEPYAAWFRMVVERTARLIAQWQCAGFCHGVMNTDNMSIIGLTLDYGPYGFLDGFNAHHICNHSDEQGRYAYDQQPLVAMWNLNALAYALSPLIPQEALKDGLRAYEPAYLAAYESGMFAKLGLENRQPDDPALLRDLLNTLHHSKSDYSLFFRKLTEESSSIKSGEDCQEWLERYSARLALETRTDEARKAAMRRANPKYILRNHLAEAAIARAREGDFSEIETLRRILSRPFDEQPEHATYAAPPPDWAAEICISCSS